VTIVGMESTGVYWRAIYYMLEDEFECRLFNAAICATVPAARATSKTLSGAAS
jgi:transposase